jgi:hypothetical protein
MDTLALNGSTGPSQPLSGRLVSQYDANLAQDSKRRLMDSLNFMIRKYGHRALHGHHLLVFSSLA